MPPASANVAIHPRRGGPTAGGCLPCTSYNTGHGMLCNSYKAKLSNGSRLDLSYADLADMKLPWLSGWPSSFLAYSAGAYSVL